MQVDCRRKEKLFFNCMRAGYDYTHCIIACLKISSFLLNPTSYWEIMIGEALLWLDSRKRFVIWNLTSLCTTFFPFGKSLGWMWNDGPLTIPYHSLLLDPCLIVVLPHCTQRNTWKYYNFASVCLNLWILLKITALLWSCQSNQTPLGYYISTSHIPRFWVHASLGVGPQQIIIHNASRNSRHLLLNLQSWVKQVSRLIS